MNKIGFIILGVLLVAFGVGQVLQMLGLIGTKSFHIAGLSFAIIGLTLGGVCFQKAFAKPPSMSDDSSLDE